MYNEIEPFAAVWLRELQGAGEIMPGVVDERSIADLKAEDLQGHERVHLFAGIGGWDYALRLAGWDPARPVWTGSCPCQPFSVAGKGKGTADERHLWPEMLRLIAECRPATVFGEQVASAAGRDWLAGVRADLEALGYAVGAADLCAAGIGAPHIRQRLFWVADRNGGRCEQRHKGQRAIPEPDQGGEVERMGYPNAAGCEAREPEPIGAGARSEHTSEPGASGRMGEPIHKGLEGHAGHGDNGREPGRQHQEQVGSAWAASVLIECADGKARRVEPGIFPLAHGVPNRVGTLRGAGNAIVPQQAAAFVRAFLESEPLAAREQ